MKTFPLPALVAAIAALFAAPFSVPAALMLFVTAGLGAIIHADYVMRSRRLRLPRRRDNPVAASTQTTHPREPHCLAA